MNTFFLVDITANCLALLLSLLTIVYIIRNKLKNTLLLVLQFSNILSQSIIISCYFPDVSPDFRTYGFIFGTQLCIVNIFLIALIDCNILEAFSILNPAITTSRITILRRVLISIFILCFCPQFMGDIMSLYLPDYVLFQTISAISTGLFGLSIVLYDNVQAIYLAVLVLRVSGNTVSKKDFQRRKFRNVVIANVLLVLFDNFGLLCNIIYASTFNYGYELLSTAFIGLHSSFILVIVATLKDSMESERAPVIKSTKLLDSNFTNDIIPNASVKTR